MKYFSLLTLVLFIASCGTPETSDTVNETPDAEEVTEVNPEAEIEPVAEEIMVDDIPDHGYDEAIAKGIDPATGLSLELSDAVALALPDWYIVSESQWLPADYVAQHNEGKPAEMQAVYEADVYAQADFNGDGIDDFAVFVVNMQNQTALYVIHQLEGGFETVLVEDLGAISDCCVGMGLSPVEAGVYNIMDDADMKRIWEIEHAGFELITYEKTAMLYKLDHDGTYWGVSTAD